MNELWKPVKGYEGLYNVSNKGNVVGIKSKKTLKPVITGPGYLAVSLCKDGRCTTKSIHIIVYDSFVGDREPRLSGYVIDHIDGDKTNNELSNLKKVTIRENLSKDKWRREPSSRYTGVSFHKNENKWQSSIYHSGKLHAIGYFSTELEAHQAYQNELKKILNETITPEKKEQ